MALFTLPARDILFGRGYWDAEVLNGRSWLTKLCAEQSDDLPSTRLVCRAGPIASTEHISVWFKYFEDFAEHIGLYAEGG